jgi:hypothetical protein
MSDLSEGAVGTRTNTHVSKRAMLRTPPQTTSLRREFLRDQIEAMD